MRRYLRRVPKGFDEWARSVLRPATYDVLPHSYALRSVIEAFGNRNGPMTIEDTRGRPAPAEKVPKIEEAKPRPAQRRGYRMLRRAPKGD